MAALDRASGLWVATIAEPPDARCSPSSAPNTCLGLGVERRGRLVEQPERPAHQEEAREADAPPLSGREIGSRQILERIESDALQRLDRRRGPAHLRHGTTARDCRRPTARASRRRDDRNSGRPRRLAARRRTRRHRALAIAAASRRRRAAASICRRRCEPREDNEFPGPPARTTRRSGAAGPPRSTARSETSSSVTGPPSGWERRLAAVSKGSSCSEFPCSGFSLRNSL